MRARFQGFVLKSCETSDEPVQEPPWHGESLLVGFQLTLDHAYLGDNKGGRQDPSVPALFKHLKQFFQTRDDDNCIFF